MSKSGIRWWARREERPPYASASPQPSIEQRQTDQRRQCDQRVADTAKSFLAGEPEHLRSQPQPDAEGGAGENGEPGHGSRQHAADQIAEYRKDARGGKKHDDVGANDPRGGGVAQPVQHDRRTADL